jgi:hypothetical protein
LSIGLKCLAEQPDRIFAFDWRLLVIFNDEIILGKQTRLSLPITLAVDHNLLFKLPFDGLGVPKILVSFWLDHYSIALVILRRRFLLTDSDFEVIEDIWLVCFIEERLCIFTRALDLHIESKLLEEKGDSTCN